MILGHAHPVVGGAVAAALELGSSFGAPTVREIDIAEAVVAAVPSIGMVRFVSSGTEAAMSAVRVARGVTDRSKIIKMTGHYHGHIDALLVQAGSAATTLGTPNSPGVTEGAVRDTILCPFNDAAAVADILTRFPGQVAAVLLEPIAGNMGLVPPRAGYLAALRDMTEKAGTLLVFDEVMTGFRVAYGGAQELYGIKPDITALGKVIGGGLPAAALGGPAELMQRLAPAGDVYQAGTLSGNPLAVAAGLATLELLDAAAYERLAAITDRLAAGLREGAAAAGIAVQVISAPGLLTVFFSESEPTSFDAVRACDLDAFAAWARELLARGVYPPPSQFEAWFPSLAHDDGRIEQTVERAAAAFAALGDRRTGA
jgi:glutamate-1-semialdehyde 2,1-aminomutase